MIFLLCIRLICVIVISVIGRKVPSQALMWIFLFGLSPILGLLGFLVFGTNFGAKYKVKTSKLTKYPFIIQLQEKIKTCNLQSHSSKNENRQTEKDKDMFRKDFYQGFITNYNQVQVFTNGESKYKQLTEQIEKAQHSIHLAYYAFHNDEIGQHFIRVLTKKAQEGVAVKLLYDPFGSVVWSKKIFKPLIEAGAQVHPVRPFLSQYRYHRKIVVIDGIVAFTGGMNVGLKYVSRHTKKKPWRDTHMQVQGESVYLLQFCFLHDWFFTLNKNEKESYTLNLNPLFPNQQVNQQLICQVVANGIDKEKNYIRLCVIRAIMLAKKSIVIQSPYFAPDETVLDVLKTALSSGVKVTLMLPREKLDHYMDAINRYNVCRLLPYGLTVYFYRGYIHSKVIRVDDSITCIGTANMDNRSMEINDELIAVFYNKEFARQQDLIIEQDKKHADLPHTEQYMKRSVLQRLKESFLLIFSPLV